MLVLVVRRQIDLGDLPRRELIVDLGQGRHLQPPVVGDVEAPGQIRRETELACQGILEGPVELEETLQLRISPLAHDAGQGLDKGRDEQPRRTALQRPFGGRDARVVALAELEVVVGIGHRLDQPSQQGAVDR